MSSLDRSVASSLDASLELVPLLPELLADLFALGGFPEADAELVATHAPPGSIENALELGSGKGAVSMALARRLGCDVIGVDGLASFVRDANQRAAEAGLADRCHFVHGDLRELSPDTVRADLVVLAGLGPLFGTHTDTVKFLDRFARPGGWMLVADGFLSDGNRVPAGCESYAGHEKTLERLQAHGHALVAERIVPPADTHADNRRITDKIRARAEGIAAREPALAPLVHDYVARQEHWDTILGDQMICATWLLRAPA